MPSEPSTGPVILNNTPLVALWAVNHLALLHHLFQEVLIPTAVYQEFLATEQSIRKAALQSAPWICVMPLVNPRQALAYATLNSGEAEVLALASELSARLVIIDERKGRQYARRLGLSITGTLGILLTAKAEGLVPTLAPLVEQLLAEGLYLGNDLVERVLEIAGER